MPYFLPCDVFSMFRGLTFSSKGGPKLKKKTRVKNCKHHISAIEIRRRRRRPPPPPPLPLTHYLLWSSGDSLYTSWPNPFTVSLRGLEQHYSYKKHCQVIFTTKRFSDSFFLVYFSGLEAKAELNDKLELGQNCLL